MHHPVLITPPAAAVTAAEARAQISGATAADDVLLDTLIAAETARLDGWRGDLGRCLVTQTWRQDFDRFARCLELPLGPVASVTSVTWRNSSGQVATVNADNYLLRTDGGGRSHVRFKDAYALPGDLYESAAVQVTFVAGEASVDDPVRQAIILRVRKVFRMAERDEALRREIVEGLGSQEWASGVGAFAAGDAMSEGLLSRYKAPRL